MPSVIWLKIRMYLIVALFFAIVYAFVSAISYLLGITNFLFYGILAIAIIGLQYLAGPKIIELTMQVKYVDEKQEPELHKIVERLAKKAGIPKPKIGISALKIPNAFAFGRWKSDGRVCVTEGILNLLDKKELEAVLGHEISHLKHRDVAIITLLSLVPMLAWYVAQSMIWARDRKGNTVLVGVLAFLIYFITNLLVLYISRIREYYADFGSVELGNAPHSLASALFKLVKSSAKLPKPILKQAEGAKAFFLNDVSKAHDEIVELSQLDVDKSGVLEPEELAILREKTVKLSTLDKLLELMSTHPNMLKRIKVLSELEQK
ncbi:MAG: zinc metalloprotease HtpX [Candidatus Nanoarchaeia archaeon]